MGVQIQKHPNRDIKFSNRKKAGKDSKLKASEVERKLREINLPINMQINLFIQNFRPLFLAVSPAIVTGLFRN